MQIIRPTPITEAMLTGSNVTEDDYAEFVMGTTYAEGDNVIVSTGVEVITLDVAPTPAAWAVGATITGSVSTETAVIISQLTSLTYEIRERTGAFTLDEILSDGTNAGNQGAAHPTVAATTDGIHKIYESLAGSNVGNYPPDDVNETVPVWLEISATNRWKIFDTIIESQMSKGSTATYQITPGTAIDSIAFMNMENISSIQVVSTDPVAGEVYNETIDLTSTALSTISTIVDWYSYFFSTINLIKNYVITDLVPYADTVIDITLTYGGDTISIGEIVIGLQANLGNTLYSPSIGIRDYSIKEQNSYGQWIIAERSFSKRMSCELTVENVNIAPVFDLLSLYRATPLVWIGSDAYNSTIIYGYFRDFSILISYPAYAICSLDIEGLI